MKPKFQKYIYFRKSSRNLPKRESVFKIIMSIIMVSIAIYSFKDLGVRVLLILILLLLIITLVALVRLSLIRKKMVEKHSPVNKYKEAIEWDEQRREREHMEELYSKYPTEAQEILDANTYVNGVITNGWPLSKEDTLKVIKILEEEKVLIYFIFGTNDNNHYTPFYRPDSDYMEDIWYLRDKKINIYSEVTDYVIRFSEEHENALFIMKVI